MPRVLRYKQKIEHAGYTRHILRRNPIRYDSEGEELDEEDEDSEADAAAAEENPFSGIALESRSYFVFREIICGRLTFSFFFFL